MCLGKPKTNWKNDWQTGGNDALTPTQSNMIREHLHHLHHAIGDQSIPIRCGITLLALLSLHALGTSVRRLGDVLGLGEFVAWLVVIAHVPAVIAVIAVWSIGCEVCHTGGST